MQVTARLWRPSLAAAITTLAVAGVSGALADTTVQHAKKPATKKVLRGPRGYRGYRGARGLQGVAGPTGPAGATGAQGPQGATGTVDTSQFYSKTQSDGRYLPIGGTAVNANQVGGLDPSDLVQSDAADTLNYVASNVESVAAPGNGDILAASLGTIHVSCADPAGVTMTLVPRSPGNSLGVIVTRAGSVATYTSTVSTPVPVLTTPQASNVVAEATVQVLSYDVGNQRNIVDTFTVSGVAGPGSANECVGAAQVTEGWH